MISPLNYKISRNDVALYLLKFLEKWRVKRKVSFLGKEIFY